MKIMNRNDECWCGSGKKYKKCHLDFDKKLSAFSKKGYEIPDRELILNEKDIEGLRKSAIITKGILDEVGQYIKPGVTTEEINTFVHKINTLLTNKNKCFIITLLLFNTFYKILS